MADKSPDKFEKFAFENDFFDVTMLDGLVGQPRLPRNLQEARDEGFKEGLAQGRAEGEAILQQELTTLRQQLETVTKTLTSQYVEWEKHITGQALNLVRVTLHRLVGHAAEHYSDQMLEHHLRHLLTLLHQGEGLTLKVHPQARSYHDKLALPQASINNLAFKIVTDPTLGPTDVIIEWPGGGLESLLTQHLQALDELLTTAGTKPLPVPAPPTSSSIETPVADAPLSLAETKTKSRADELLGDDDLVDALK